MRIIKERVAKRRPSQWLAMINTLQIRPIAFTLLGVLLGAGSEAAFGAATGESYAPEDAARPRIGLVLAGGGAKGGAHVGVLKVMEELRVPVDCIAGTSMGALVGAGYASGIPADELEEFVTSIDWKLVVGGLGQRDLQPAEQKRSAVTYSNSLELGIKDGAVKIPGGVVSTLAIEDLLRSYVAKARAQPNFDKLPVPFRAVATDMVTGEMVVFRHGDLATALRASMAIPGAFAPVYIGDQILSDGGLVRNIPVDVARELCAEVVIVVNLVEPAVDPSNLQSATQLLSRSMDVMIVANEKLQLDSLTERDILIDIATGDIGTADFERIPETIPLGEAAARGAAERLSAFAVSDAEYLAWRDRVTEPQEIKAQLAGISYEGLERVSPEYLETRSQLEVGEIVDNEAISAEARRMSALREFESTEYRMEGDPESPTLVWLPKEKRWGPNYLQVDLGLYASGGGDLAFSLYARHRRTWLNRLGAEWRNVLEVGYDSQLKTGFYQPLDFSQTFFIEPAAGWLRTQEDIFIEGSRAATYLISNLGARIDFGVNVGNNAQLRAGYGYVRRDVEVETGSPVLEDRSHDDAGWLLSASYDSRDTPFNPTSGFAAAVEYLQSDRSLGASRSWERLEMGFGAAIPVLNDIVWLALAGGTELGSELPTDRYFAVGGPNSFPGYQLGEIWSEEYWLASSSYLWQVKELFSLRGQALYVGAQLTVGENNDRLDIIDDGTVYGGALYLTGRTLVGPLTVGFGLTSKDASSIWLSVGRPIGRGTILERGIFR